MASPVTLDFDALLAPVSGDSPGGVDPSADVASAERFRALVAARKDALLREQEAMEAGAAVLRQGGGWEAVRDAAVDLLVGQAKDLRIASWLLEAALRVEGFAGLRDGLRLLLELVRVHWEHLHPRPDEDGLAGRVAPLVGLIGAQRPGALIWPIRLVPLTAVAGADDFALHHFVLAVELERIDDDDIRAKRLARGVVTLETIRAAAAGSPPSFYRDLIDDVEAATAHFDALASELLVRCGAADAPPTSNLRNVLEEVTGALRQLGAYQRADLGERDPGADHQQDGALEEATWPETGGRVGAPALDRQRALATLRRIAAFFRATEPHSPISYGIEQVVRWGEMDLPALLSEIVRDEAVREETFRLTGVPKPPDREAG